MCQIYFGLLRTPLLETIVDIALCFEAVLVCLVVLETSAPIASHPISHNSLSAIYQFLL